MRKNPLLSPKKIHFPTPDRIVFGSPTISKPHREHQEPVPESRKQKDSIQRQEERAHEVTVAAIKIQSLDGDDLVGRDVDRPVHRGAGPVPDLLQELVVRRRRRVAAPHAPVPPHSPSPLPRSSVALSLPVDYRPNKKRKRGRKEGGRRGVRTSGRIERARERGAVGNTPSCGGGGRCVVRTSR